MKNEQVIFKGHPYRWKASVVLGLLAIGVVTTEGSSAAQTETTETTKALHTAVATVTSSNMPAVVHVEAIKRQEALFPGTEGAIASPSIKHFLNLAKTSAKIRQELRMFGTGTIIDPLGHVVTNCHVVAGATLMYVVLTDGRKYTAKLVGIDRDTDLAVIRLLTRDPLPHVVFGDSDTVELGETVTAVSHFCPRDPSAKRGTILAKHGRDGTSSIEVKDYFGKEPTVNMEFGGGPLCNLAGQVIAVNAVILSPSAEFDGIALSIPSNLVLRAARQLITGRKVKDASTGQTPEFFTTSLPGSTNVAEPQGMSAISPVRRDEIERRNIKKELITTGPGHHISAGVVREETATLVNSHSGSEAFEKIPVVGNAQEPGAPEDVLIKKCLGMAARAATQQEAEKFHLKSGKTLVINWLDPSGPLARAGVELDDMLLEINGRPISSLDHLMHVVSRMSPRQRVIMVVLDHRTGRTGYVQVHTH